jgi:hypothetical protein
MNEIITPRTEFHQVYIMRLFNHDHSFLPLKIELKMKRDYNYFGDTPMEIKRKNGDFNQFQKGRDGYKLLGEISSYRNHYVYNDGISMNVQIDFDHNETILISEKQ